MALSATVRALRRGMHELSSLMAGPMGNVNVNKVSPLPPTQSVHSTLERAS